MAKAPKARAYADGSEARIGDVVKAPLPGGGYQIGQLVEFVGKVRRTDPARVKGEGEERHKLQPDAIVETDPARDGVIRRCAAFPSEASGAMIPQDMHGVEVALAECYLLIR